MTDPQTAAIAERIVRAREGQGLTTAQLARRLGVQTKTLTRWEAGESEPRSNRLVNLAGVLNVSPAWLLAGDGEEPVVDAVRMELTRLKNEVDKARTDLQSVTDLLSGISTRLGDLEEAREAEIEADEEDE